MRKRPVRFWIRCRKNDLPTNCQLPQWGPAPSVTGVTLASRAIHNSHRVRPCVAAHPTQIQGGSLSSRKVWITARESFLRNIPAPSGAGTAGIHRVTYVPIVSEQVATTTTREGVCRLCGGESRSRSLHVMWGQPQSLSPPPTIEGIVTTGRTVKVSRRVASMYQSVCG